MSFFGVTVEQIEKVWPHPNADKLELAKCKNLDFQFVVGKGTYKPEDFVIYFPIDSILPPEMKEQLGLQKMPGFRIKTIRLRGEISQGMVAPLDIMPFARAISSEELTAKLGVTKYDPPVEITSAGVLVELPDGQGKYDIEGVERFPQILEKLMSVPVVITEKLEGTNASVSRVGGKMHVCQRNNAIVPIEGKDNIYWKVAKESGIYDVVEKHPDDLTVYFELIGPKIQGNIYRLVNHEARVFDIKRNGRFVDFKEFVSLTTEFNFKTVPILLAGMLEHFLAMTETKTVTEASNGMSLLFNTRREGIVIKPQQEMSEFGFGRVILKKRSPEYLENEK